MDALYDFLPVPSANAEDTIWHDLNKWTEAHLIGIEGRAPHRVYVKSAFNPVAM